MKPKVVHEWFVMIPELYGNESKNEFNKNNVEIVGMINRFVRSKPKRYFSYRIKSTWN